MIKRLGAGKRLSMATIHYGLVYLAGHVPDDLSVGIEAQASQVLGKIDALLAEAGTDKSSILTATVWGFRTLPIYRGVQHGLGCMGARGRVAGAGLC